MAYSVLNKLKSEGVLRNCSITVSDSDSFRRHKTIFGRDVVRITVSGIELLGGETGHESLSVPINSVQEIRSGGRVVYRKKKRIERIYPR
jgi:uncharacterized protein (UPF0248 family)